MNSNIPDSLIRTIQENQVFCLLSHSEPDGDSLGSQLALDSFLKRIGKSSHLYSPGPFGRSEIAVLEHRFERRIDDAVLAERPVIVILDCSTLDRVGELAADIEGQGPVIVIDHHTAGVHFGDIRYIDTGAPSVTLLVQLLIERMGYSVESSEARWILFGFCTDTGFFRHIDTTDSEVFEAVGRITAAGATPKQIYRMIYGDRSIEARILLGALLGRTRAHLDGRVLVTYETLADKRTYGEANRDSDALYQQLQTVKGCEAVIFIREEDDGVCSVGLRSNNSLDVGSIAKSFGGGGHTRAAGFTSQGERETVETRVLRAVAEALEKTDSLN